jgi:hypothetical protein
VVRSFSLDAGLNSMLSFREYRCSPRVRETILIPTFDGGKSESVSNASICVFNRGKEDMLRAPSGEIGAG